MSGGNGVAGIRKALHAPRTNPVGVLVTHIPILAIWLFLVVRDALDGVIKTRWAGDVSRSTDPLNYYLTATLLIGVVLVLAFQVMRAWFALAEQDGD